MGGTSSKFHTLPTDSDSSSIFDIRLQNLLTKFHDDRTINVASRVFTRFYYRENASPHGDFISTSLLRQFHEDQTIHVVSRSPKMVNFKVNMRTGEVVVLRVFIDNNNVHV
ncbi:hypothetical protein DPMN_040241 [Dreissena polymorpha]|uniref:Uncharacterized protein n=1 Tax=Dreissena polymorpha TaxID=45954 RepID=A0A9D4CXF4_DREPO|nr:hypothetical protein DPMN_040241 [Dreissena polymorpha]